MPDNHVVSIKYMENENDHSSKKTKERETSKKETYRERKEGKKERKKRKKKFLAIHSILVQSI